jgi:alkanesulfonate monooxygenase SsuD/methylene tetrahydromethanopterin reductase-like flavin-dependent oxidoreductase (luciferase family)
MIAEMGRFARVRIQHNGGMTTLGAICLPQNPPETLRDIARAADAAGLEAVTLDWPPATAPGLLIAATGPKTLALAGELGDGTVLSGGTSPAAVAAAKKLIDPADGHDIIVFVPAVTGPDAAARRRAAAEQWDGDYAGLAGSPADIADGVHEFAAAGATRVILQPLPDEPDPAAYVHFVADQIRPLVD